MYEPLTTPVEYELGYTLPDEYGAAVFDCDFVEDRFYLPSTAHPSFKVVYMRTS